MYRWSNKYRCVGIIGFQKTVPDKFSREVHKYNSGVPGPAAGSEKLDSSNPISTHSGAGEKVAHDINVEDINTIEKSSVVVFYHLRVRPTRNRVWLVEGILNHPMPFSGVPFLR